MAPMLTLERSRGFSSVRVCQIAGITYRQLDYWVRLGLVKPSVQASYGTGQPRRFSEADVKLVAVVKALMGRVEPRQVTQAIDLVSAAMEAGEDPEVLWVSDEGVGIGDVEAMRESMTGAVSVVVWLPGLPLAA